MFHRTYWYRTLYSTIYYLKCHLRHSQTHVENKKNSSIRHCSLLFRNERTEFMSIHSIYRVLYIAPNFYPPIIMLHNNSSRRCFCWHFLALIPSEFFHCNESTTIFKLPAHTHSKLFRNYIESYNFLSMETIGFVSILFQILGALILLHFLILFYPLLHLLSVLVL